MPINSAGRISPRESPTAPTILLANTAGEATVSCFRSNIHVLGVCDSSLSNRQRTELFRPACATSYLLRRDAVLLLQSFSAHIPRAARTDRARGLGVFYKAPNLLFPPRALRSKCH